jgi:hypothetical protein
MDGTKKVCVESLTRFWNGYKFDARKSKSQIIDHTYFLFQVLTEVEKIVECLQPHTNGTVVDVVRYTDLAVGSVIHNVLFGHGFDEVSFFEQFRLTFTNFRPTAPNLTVSNCWPLS